MKRLTLFLVLSTLMASCNDKTGARVQHIHSEISQTQRNMERIEETLSQHRAMKEQSIHYKNLVQERIQLQSRLDSLRTLLNK